MGRRLILFVSLLGFVASCENLTCDTNKKEARKRLNLGVEHAGAKNWSAAEKELDAAATLDPKLHLAAFLLGQVYEDQKKWDKAVDAFSRAVKHGETEAMYHYKLGRSLFETNKLDPARKEIERALELNKRLFKAHWYLGRILARQGKPKEAATSWTAAAMLNARFGKPFIDLGKLYYEWDFFDQAVQVLVQGAKYAMDAEDKTRIFYYLGRTYDSQKKYGDAAQAYEDAIKAKENIEARLQAGMAYASKGDKPNAKKHLKEFLKMGGGNNPFNIQAAQFRLNKLEQD